MPFFNHYILENPPPPNDDFDYTTFPLPEHFLWSSPQNIPGPEPIEINYNLIHKSFFMDEDSEEDSDEHLKDAQDQIQQEQSDVQKESIPLTSKVRDENKDLIGSSVLKEKKVEEESEENFKDAQDQIQQEQSDVQKERSIPLTTGQKTYKKEEKREDRKCREHFQVKEKDYLSSDVEIHSTQSEKGTDYISSDEKEVAAIVARLSKLSPHLCNLPTLNFRRSNFP